MLDTPLHFSQCLERLLDAATQADWERVDALFGLYEESSAFIFSSLDKNDRVLLDSLIRLQAAVLDKITQRCSELKTTLSQLHRHKRALCAYGQIDSL